MSLRTCYFFLFLFSYLVVGVCGSFIEMNLHFSMLDEIVVVASFGLLCIDKLYLKKKWSKGIVFLGVVWLILFVCSLGVHANVQKAIVQGAIQQLKPFLLFFTLMEINVCLSDYERKFLLKMTVVLGFCLPIIAFVSRVDADHSLFFNHMANYGNLMMMTSLLFFMLSRESTSSKVLFVLFLLCGLLSLRSKYYGEAIIAIVTVLFVKNKIKFNLRYCLLFACALFCVIYFAWEKISIYVISGNESLARTALYRGSFALAIDYFPIGSGFGSFADDASRLYYSPIYYIYDLASIWGLSPNYPNFITDTYFPVVIGQFGFLGVFLICFFYAYLYRYVCNLYSERRKKAYLIGIILISVFFVESLAGSAFVSYLGVPYIFLMTENMKSAMDYKKRGMY